MPATEFIEAYYFVGGFVAGLLLSVLFGFLVWMRVSGQSKRDIEALRHRARMDKRQTESLARNQHETIEAQTEIIDRQKSLIEELRDQVNELESGAQIHAQAQSNDRVDDLEQHIEDNKRRIAELEMALQSEKSQSRQKMDVLKERLGTLLSEIENKPSTKESTKDMARQIKTQIFGPPAPTAPANSDAKPADEEPILATALAPKGTASVPAAATKERRWKRRRWTG